MSTEQTTRSAEWQQVMRRDWDERARKNGMHYICCEQLAWDRESFLSSGEREVRRLVDPFLRHAGYDPSRGRMLEIGSGMGRMTRSFAHRFARVDALDVSPEMVERARNLCGREPNITWWVGNGIDLRDWPAGCFDFVFSYIVFQHLPSPDLVLGYVAEIGRVLKPSGLFKFQLRTVTIEPQYFWQARVRLGLSFWRMLRRARVLRHPRLSGLAESRDSLKGDRPASWTGNAVQLAKLKVILASSQLDYSISGAGTQYTWVSGSKRARSKGC